MYIIIRKQHCHQHKINVYCKCNVYIYYIYIEGNERQFNKTKSFYGNSQMLTSLFNKYGINKKSKRVLEV